MAVQEAVPQQPARSAYLAKSVLKSSVVRQAVQGHVRLPTSLDVVLGKETVLELVVVTEDGMVQSVCEQSVFGSIRDLRVLPWNDLYQNPGSQAVGKDLLVLLSDSEKLSFLTFSMDQHRFVPLSHRALPQSNFPLRDLGNHLAVHPRGRAVAVGAFEDRLAIFPASIQAGKDIVEQMIAFPPSVSVLGSTEASISGERLSLMGWGTIWSMAFVSLTDDSSEQGSELLLAVLLHRRGTGHLELQILVCDTMRRSIMVSCQFNPSAGITPGPIAYNILDVPALPGFLILLRHGDLMLVDVRSTKSIRTVAVVKLADDGSMGDSGAHPGKRLGDEEINFNAAASALLLLTRDADSSASIYTGEGGKSVEAPPSGASTPCLDQVPSPYVNAWTWEPGQSQSRLILGLDSGHIYAAKISAERPDIVVGRVEYTCAPSSILLWTKGSFLLVFIHMGDGQVLQVTNAGLTFKSFIPDITPALDFTLVNFPGRKEDRIFTCSGAGREGSIRVIRNGHSVERLLSTPASYTGVTNIWTIRMHRADINHAFLVISFVGETRVLSVGLSFVDITDDVGFDPFARTLSCGRMEDGWVAQICNREVRLCAPTSAAHLGGLICELPAVSLWNPGALCVSLGAVAQGKIILALSHPGVVVMLGSCILGNGLLQLVELQRCQLAAEISSICIPDEEQLGWSPVPPSLVGLAEGNLEQGFPSGVEVGNICLVGTHKPSVELLSMVPGEGFCQLATAAVKLFNPNGTPLGGCVPESVRLAVSDCLYILAGLRNGFLLRYEWTLVATQVSANQALAAAESRCSGAETSFDSSPGRERSFVGQNKSSKVDGRSKPVQLHLVSVRRIGISPVSLIPLTASLRSDILILGDRPWLLQTARQTRQIWYTSISFQPSTCATPVSMQECHDGILFVADCSLHLVELDHARLNGQRLSLGKMPWRVKYHSTSNTLLVIRLGDGDGHASDICCVDPVSGTLHSCYKLDPGEIARSITIWKRGHDEVIVIGTSLNTGPIVLPNGEPESGKGRILVFQLRPRHSPGSVALSGPPPEDCMSESWPGSEGVGRDVHMLSESEGWELILKSQQVLSGVVLAVCPYMGQYLLASAGNALCCLGLRQDGSQRLRRLAVVRTRFMITSISVHLMRIAVGDCCDGVLLYSFREDDSRLELLYCDPGRRLVSSCALIDEETVMATDWHGGFCSLTCAHSAEGVNPERNLIVTSWYNMGETVTRLCKGSFSYRMPMEGKTRAYIGSSSSNLPFIAGSSSVVACSTLGSILIFMRITSEEYDLLKEVQSRLAVYPPTAPLLGNEHAAFRRKGCPAGADEVLDGDMLWQFLELTSAQQQAVLSLQPPKFPEVHKAHHLSSMHSKLSLDQVLRVLDGVHNLVT